MTTRRVRRPGAEEAKVTARQAETDETLPRDPFLLYDGECPFCSFYAEKTRFETRIGRPLRLVDARNAPMPTSGLRRCNGRGPRTGFFGGLKRRNRVPWGSQETGRPLPRPRSASGPFALPSLDAAEERYDPMVSLSAGANAGSRGDETADISIGPNLRVPTGGTFRLSWSKPLAGERDREASTNLTFRQPLHRGSGRLSTPGRCARPACGSARMPAHSGTRWPGSSSRSSALTGVRRAPGAGSSSLARRSNAQGGSSRSTGPWSRRAGWRRRTSSRRNRRSSRHRAGRDRAGGFRRSPPVAPSLSPPPHPARLHWPNLWGRARAGRETCSTAPRINNSAIAINICLCPPCAGACRSPRCSDTPATGGAAVRRRTGADMKGALREGEPNDRWRGRVGPAALVVATLTVGEGAAIRKFRHSEKETEG